MFDTHNQTNERLGAHLVSKIILGLCVCAILVLVGGYGLFRSAIEAHKGRDPASLHAKTSAETGETQIADGIVVLTGDKARIRTGLSLLDGGMAKRALVSGVNALTSREAVYRVAGYSPSDLPCCVEIGYTAADTIGNAEETSKWADHNGVSSLLVVTSDYHMPRSLLELSFVMPEVELIPVVAETTDNPDFLRHTLREYGKYLAARLRHVAAAENVTGYFAANAAD